ncbi:MAG: undecaprenyl-diphosphate phosphatase [Bacteroidales bacterium]|nr:undecaprenyl-diphosphate phosphatase [Bacteroidales bacterium]
MEWFQALILGLIQGLTEFLPISSSGHLVIGKEVLGIDAGDPTFEILVHAATVCSTLVVFRKEIAQLFFGLFKFKYNEETEYVFKIVVSMIPVLIVGLFFKDFVKDLFGEGVGLVGIMLLITAALLLFTQIFKPKKEHSISYKDAFIIGLAQAVAVLPGLSRSGSTIATGLLVGDKKSEVAKFSFLMVLVPILGEAFLELLDGQFHPAESGISISSMIIGFLAAFISGWFACRVMIEIVKRSKLTYFAIYCAIVGLVAVGFSIF